MANQSTETEEDFEDQSTAGIGEQIETLRKLSVAAVCNPFEDDENDDRELVPAYLRVVLTATGALPVAYLLSILKRFVDGLVSIGASARGKLGDSETSLVLKPFILLFGSPFLLLHGLEQAASWGLGKLKEICPEVITDGLETGLQYLQTVLVCILGVAFFPVTALYKLGQTLRDKCRTESDDTKNALQEVSQQYTLGQHVGQMFLLNAHYDDARTDAVRESSLPLS